MAVLENEEWYSLYSLIDWVRVLEVGEFISAPYCGKLLTDLGAEVIKIEPPGAGDGSRQYGPFRDAPDPERSGLFLYLNANKKGITLDLASATGQDVLKELVARSDVLVVNLHPLAMDRYQLDYDSLSRANPKLVMAAVTPFGLTGPYRNYKAYDINLTAAGGISVGLGEPDREPLTFGTPQVGYFAAMAAASSIMVALLALDQLGAGQLIDISEAEVVAGAYNGPEALMAVYQWRETRRTGHHALDFPYPNCILRCKDGYIFVGSPEGRQWRQLLEVMGNPEWAREPRFRSRTAMNNQYADEVDAYMEEWLTKYTKAELLQIALEHRIPLAPVRTFDEVCHDESLAGLFQVIEREDTGPVAYPGAPYVLEGRQSMPHRPAPYLGQHNDAVYLSLLDWSKDKVTQMRESGVL